MAELQQMSDTDTLSMSELRKDPIVNRWVIIAASRGMRPCDFEPSERQPERTGWCPFCPGNETRTPQEIYAISNGSGPGGPNWQVRVVPNKFPALSIEADVRRWGIGLLDRMGGFGAHEVVIESPDHSMDLAVSPIEHIALVVEAFKERTLDLRKDPRFRQIVIFRNFGPTAGASLAHPHSQIIGLPIVPIMVQNKLDAARSHFELKERCIYCDMLEQELKEQERIVLEDDYFVVLSPFAARFPFELHIYPRRHCHDFVLMNDVEKLSFAGILKRTLSLYRDYLSNPPYNMMIQTAPNNLARVGSGGYPGALNYAYHWHVEITPRLTTVAGFEWATGFYINPVSPELARGYLCNEVVEPALALH